jgi:hypothetical protein
MGRDATPPYLAVTQNSQSRSDARHNAFSGSSRVPLNRCCIECQRWKRVSGFEADTLHALALLRPLPDDALRIVVARGEKEEGERSTVRS